MQKANFNKSHDLEMSKKQTFGETVINLYRNALDSLHDDVATSGLATTRGLKRKYETMIVYGQDKVVLNFFYIQYYTRSNKDL